MHAEYLVGVVSASEVRSGSTPIVSGHLLEDDRLLLPEVVLGDARDRNWSLLASGHQLHQRLRVGIGQGLEEYGIHHRKDRGIHANAGGNDEERDRSESGCPAKGTQREAQVAPSIFDPEEGPMPQTTLMRQAKISGAQTSLASRFQRRKATRGIRVLFMSQVRLDFLGPILVFLRAMREAT